MVGKPKSKSVANSILAGGVAGGIEAVMMYPTEFVKTQLQLQNKTNPKYTSPWNCAVVIVKERGLIGLYRGLSVLLVGSIPKSASRFGAFEFCSNFLKDEKGNLSPFNTLICGLGAGLTEAVVAVTPMEMIKTRLIHDQNAPPEQRKYKGLAHGVTTIVKNEGITGLYKGLAPTLVKQGTNQATRFFVFTELQKWFKSRDPNFGVFHSLFCGAMAGAASVMVNNPIDVVKTKMQGLEAGLYKNSFDCARSILVNQGPMFFYRGATPRLVRVCGDAAIAFTVYGKIIQFIDWFTDELKKKK